MFLGSATPHPMGRGPANSKFVGPPTCELTIRETVAEFFTVTKTREGDNLQGSPRLGTGENFTYARRTDAQVVSGS